MNKVFATAALSAFASTAALAAPVLEPHAQAFAAAAAKAAPLYTLPYDEARQVLSTVQSSTVASPATVSRDDVWPIGPTGKVRVRIVRPENARGSLPAVMYFHGGGWVMGDRNTHDHLIRELSAQAHAAVVFVEYDNAPDVQYPENNEQAYAALEYIVKHANALDLDADRIAVAGDSAGGNMAAAVTLLSKERQGPRIIHQVLFYPVTDDVSDNASYRVFGEGPFLTRKAMDYFLEANFPDEYRDDVLAFPLKATVKQLEGLPSATVIVAEIDLLRDEGEAYARKLLQADVAVTSTRYIGTIHDFVMLNALADSAPAKAAIAQASTELRAAFAK
ncbi:alpha/beta hydrolase [Sinorhizobium fredii]|uniref:alpha/beta hydrolase n=1 Tax=Rhizobium fredii TaxID=380 RepID=UPI0035194151